MGIRILRLKAKIGKLLRELLMKKTLSIMVVDDESVERNGIVRFLKSVCGDLLIDSFESGKAASTALKESTYDILITDIKIPFISGLELAEMAQKIQPSIKTVIVSAYAEFKFAQEAVLIGAVNYLLKPVDTDWLKKFIQKELDALTETTENIDFTPTTCLLLSTAEKKFSKPVKDCINVIENEYSKSSLNLEDLSRKVFISTGYLCNIFKKEAGVSVVRFLNSYRMEKARELLLTTNLKINSVYTRVGFESFPHFSNSFKTHFGVSPSKFRSIGEDT